jgi:hypothetical protein
VTKLESRGLASLNAQPADGATLGRIYYRNQDGEVVYCEAMMTRPQLDSLAHSIDGGRTTSGVAVAVLDKSKNLTRWTIITHQDREFDDGSIARARLVVFPSTVKRSEAVIEVAP